METKRAEVINANSPALAFSLHRTAKNAGHPSPSGHLVLIDVRLKDVYQQAARICLISREMQKVLVWP